MKLEWNITLKKQNSVQFLFFYNFLLMNYNFLFFTKNKELFFKIFKFLNLKKTTTFLPTFDVRLNNVMDKKLKKFNTLTIGNILEKKNKTDDLFEINFLIKKDWNDFLPKIINLFFIFNYAIYDSQFKNHHFFKLSNFGNFGRIPFMLNVNKIINRWKNSYFLIFNIFYYNFNIFIFGSYLFKNEISSLNWISNDWNWNAWRYHFNFFTFRTNVFNKKIEFFYEKLAALELDFFFITDPHFHFKNIYFFNKFKFFTVALTNINLDPTLFSYSIPIATSNTLFQFFFFKFLILIHREVKYAKYGLYKKIWWNHRKGNSKII